jgi:molecular chaperone DnaK (HSP70)
LEGIGDDEQALAVLQRFLEKMAQRLTEVLTPGALSIADGASANLGVPADWDQGRIERLAHAAMEAGFPVSRVAPRPLAALACHLQQGTIKPGAGTEKTLVVDWGGSSLALSFIEHGPDLPKPQVFEHIEHPLGGDWFDQRLFDRITGQLAPGPAAFGRELGEQDYRELLLFARKFKEQMSRAFAEGKNAYSQYCIIPAGSAPLRIRLEQSEFESLAAEGRDRFRAALAEALNTVSLKPEHIDHLILAGGGAAWYFAREDARLTLGQVPIIGTNPQETFARGLAVYRLRPNGVREGTV